jgi:hypothetical protein
VTLCASDAPTTGFCGFTLSLVVSQPATVDRLVGAAPDAGATPLKPTKKGFWGYGGVIQAPDETIWKVATSSKKDTGLATRQIDEIVLLLGVADVPQASGSTSTAAWRWRGASAASTSSSPRHTSRWRSTGAARWARTPAPPRTAPARTESPLAAMPAPLLTRTGSRGSGRAATASGLRDWRVRDPTRNLIRIEGSAESSGDLNSMRRLL